MLTRALIVVLVILNLGVALWWLLRGEPVSEPPASPVGVAQLEVLPPTQAPPAAAIPTNNAPALQDVTPASAPAAAPVAQPPVTPEVPPTAVAATPAPTPAATAVAPATAAPAVAPPAPVPPPTAPAQCVSLGPFADRATAQAAQSRAGSALRAARLREVADAGATRYRVLLPPAASREEAQATVKRIVAAGVSDYYIIAQGEETHAIALGQYRNREGADRRLAALSAAGFKAKMVASGGDGSAQWWLDATLAAGTEAAAARQRSGAAQQRSLECARVR
ncbi:SPOR domain-containing protein [Stenotrophomonas sp. JAI102]|uniref:SPOR domain-containing protein n=1 Tax=Stenotrophomonas sp. JAI102 TaxID=2723077 RepID=UPI0015C9C2A2|nr:SPOR domain-containing protein [Stenotrophomonas sp. JAI102]NYF36935.1 septal ring-binding cell division protein DamX [Stenotrophomonas sp. JAI102]